MAVDGTLRRPQSSTSDLATAAPGQAVQHSPGLSCLSAITRQSVYSL